MPRGFELFAAKADDGFEAFFFADRKRAFTELVAFRQNEKWSFPENDKLLHGTTRLPKVSFGYLLTGESCVFGFRWDKLAGNGQQKLVRNKQIRNSVSNKTSWLGGKLVCEKCGRTMTTIKGKVNGDEIRRYFNCTGKSHFRDCTGTRVTIYADSIENMMYDAIGKKLETLKAKGRQKNDSLSPLLNELRNKLKRVELEESKLADTILRDEVGVELLTILSSKAEKLKRDKLDILAKIDELQSKEIDTKAAVNLAKKWRTASFEEKRGVAGILIDKRKIKVLPAFSVGEGAE